MDPGVLREEMAPISVLILQATVGLALAPNGGIGGRYDPSATEIITDGTSANFRWDTGVDPSLWWIRRRRWGFP